MLSRAANNNRLDKNFTVNLFSRRRLARQRCAPRAENLFPGGVRRTNTTGAEIFRHLRNANPAAFVETAWYTGCTRSAATFGRSVVVATVLFVRRADRRIVFRPRVYRVASGPHRQTACRSDLARRSARTRNMLRYYFVFSFIVRATTTREINRTRFFFFFFFTQNRFDRTKPDVIVTNQKQTNRRFDQPD